jgi:prevent-host-death family protein
MLVSIADAKRQLAALVRRAEAGDEIILTRHGQNAVRLVPVKAVSGRKSRHLFIQAMQAAAALKMTEGVSAAQSQDFLYGGEGLPE